MPAQDSAFDSFECMPSGELLDHLFLVILFQFLPVRRPSHHSSRTFSKAKRFKKL